LFNEYQQKLILNFLCKHLIRVNNEGIKMKKTLLSTAIVLSMAATMNSYANDEGFDQEQLNQKEAVTVTSGAIIGAIAGGPLGLLAGIYAGDILGKELSKADNYEDSINNNLAIQQQLLSSKENIAALKLSLQQAQEKQQSLHSLAASQLELQVLFHTGDDTLNEKDYHRLQELAEFLNNNPQYNIRLHGHADPRGTDGYNNVLSQYRAKSVRSVLEEGGIESERIDSQFYGAIQSKAVKGDLDAYAFERRVSIEIFRPSDNLVLSH